MTETLIGTPDPDEGRRHVAPWSCSTPGVILLSNSTRTTAITRVDGAVYVGAATNTAVEGWSWAE